MACGRLPSDDLIDAALTLAETQGWAGLSLARIAQAAQLSLADAHAACPTKTAILAAFNARLDRTVLTGDDPALLDEAPRDRLFDVAMRRFDAMLPHRAAILAIHRDLIRDPLALAALLPQSLRAMATMIEAAGLDSTGWRGALRCRALAYAMARVFLVWLEEEDQGQAKTMASLDRHLRRVEGFVGALSGRRTGSRFA